MSVKKGFTYKYPTLIKNKCEVCNVKLQTILSSVLLMGHKFEERNQVMLFSKNNIGELKTSKHLKFMMLCFVKTIISW